MEYSKDHPSIRVHAPPGGHSNNIFGQAQDEQSAANKKKNTQSDIFGTKTDNVNAAPAKPARNTGNNIFGTDPEESAPKGGTIAGQYKQSQMKSNIFGSDEPTTTRNVPNKSQSNVFSTPDDDQAKRQGGIRHGLRVGYNPINGESYNTAPKVNETEKQQESTAETPAAETPSTESVPTENSTNNGQTPSTGTENTQPATSANENGKIQSNDNVQKQEPAPKPVHTSVRVFHPPGGRSNGPLW